MRYWQTLFAALLLSQSAVADTTTIAFGSCLRQWKPVPILDTVRLLEPDAFIFAGDNVYTDTGLFRFMDEPGRISKAYQQLEKTIDYRLLKESTRLLATWDDHDYGQNNAGAEYAWKQEAKQQFLDFFEIPDDAPMRQRPGIYDVHYLGNAEHRIQILLLDTRTFRSPLQQAEPNQQCPRSRLVATSDRTTTLLGDDQWRWLSDQLKQPAALRLVVSSIQVIPDQHCYEKWGNFPHERQRLIDLIRGADAKHTIIISGDRHLGEISTLPSENTFPLYEITASGLNSAGAGKGEHNPYRISEDNVRVDHFGVVRLISDDAEPVVELALYDVEGVVIQRALIDYASWQMK